MHTAAPASYVSRLPLQPCQKQSPQIGHQKTYLQVAGGPQSLELHDQGQLCSRDVN